jgi:hypothetical protein
LAQSVQSAVAVALVVKQTIMAEAVVLVVAVHQTVQEASAVLGQPAKDLLGQMLANQAVVAEVVPVL